MKRAVFAMVAGLACSVSGAAFAQQDATVPAVNVAYARCVENILNTHPGSDGPSDVAGQTRAQAWCTCMLYSPEETYDHVVEFAETSEGRNYARSCRKHLEQKVSGRWR